MLTNGAASAIIALALVSVQRKSLYGGIAQLGERLNGIQEVSGSIPLISTKTRPQSHGFVVLFYLKVNEDSDTKKKELGVFQKHSQLSFCLVQAILTGRTIIHTISIPTAAHHEFLNICLLERKYLNYQTIGTTT